MKLKEVYKALVNKIKLGLEGSEFDSVEFTTTDIKEGFERPSFFIEIDETNLSLATNLRIKKTVPINLFYFPTSSEKFKIELMEVQDFLENILLDPIQVEESAILIEDLYFSKPDGVLKLSFEIETIEAIERIDDSEIIETINYE